MLWLGPKNKDAFYSGYRSPSSVSAIEGEGMSGRGLGGLSNSGSGYGYKELRRTPSTSAIYETLRRSKELRESLTRPSSRLSMDEKMRDSVSPVGYVMKVRRLTLMHLIAPESRIDQICVEKVKETFFRKTIN